MNTTWTDGWHTSSNVKFNIKDEQMHSIEGPAVIHPDGYHEHWINGVFYTKQDWLKEVKKYYDSEEDYTLMLLKY